MTSGMSVEAKVTSLTWPCLRLQIVAFQLASHYINSIQPNIKTAKAILVHPDWASYVEQHFAVVRGWAAWEWLTYMQKRNPSTPAIANKLFMPTKRDSLSKQTEYWKVVMRSQELHCIYSHQQIDPERFSLDHYLPWSFVAHNQLWNLIPTVPEVNSAKSNHLPADKYKYFERFVALQHQGLTLSHHVLPEGKWSKQVEPYVSDLGFSNQEDLLVLEKLGNAYEQVLKPLVLLAANQGFSIDWQIIN